MSAYLWHLCRDQRDNLQELVLSYHVSCWGQAQILNLEASTFTYWVIWMSQYLDSWDYCFDSRLSVNMGSIATHLYFVDSSKPQFIWFEIENNNT